ncbi:MAG: helix-turn-helix domain-containing protein [Oscillospiraceae bacterium]|jgi:transposase-like protein|nr:helix-turn-helix domain-containing protein [Oscillospiraceae bacterium]
MGTYGKSNRELKFEIMKKHFQDGVSVRELAETYGFPIPTVYGWRSQYRTHGANAFIGCGNSRSTESEIARLRSENIRLKNERSRLLSELGYDARHFDENA